MVNSGGNLHPVRASSSLDPADRDWRGPARGLVRSLVGMTLAYFSEREDEHLLLIREHLLDLVDARPSQARAQNLRSACVLLHKHAEAFNRAFQAALQTTLEDEVRLVFPQPTSASLSGQASTDSLDGMSLSLIDVCEVERILLLDRVAQRFTAHYDACIGPLTLRLGRVLRLDAPALSSNPFRPEVFVRAFLLAWEQSGLDDQATEDLMQALEPQHSIDLTPLYTDLNVKLMQAGIEAKTVHRIKRSDNAAFFPAPLGGDSASVPLSQSQADDAPVSTRSGLGDLDQAHGPSARSRLESQGRGIAARARQFLQRLGLGSPQEPLGARDGETPAWSQMSGAGDRASLAGADPEFMGYLGDLQAGAGAFSPNQAAAGRNPADHNILREMRDREEVRRAPELDRGTVDALAEVFDFVFADQSIPPQMKFVIGRLQIPVLKAAMIDRDFFLSAEHPARRLVDTLAQASIAWAPEKGENDPLYVRIENTVKRVLNEFEDDLTLFSDLLLEFTEYLFETEQQAQGRIEPAADHELVGESFEQALAHADEVIHARIQALPLELPLAAFLAPFLASQWRQVMARAWLNVATSPAQWEGAVLTMDQLIWSTQPKVRTDERRQLVAVLPDLVRSLNAGLDAIDWTGEDRATFTRRLISTHMMAIRLTQAAHTDATTAVLEVSAGQEAMQELDQRRAGKRAGSVDEFDAMAHSFSRGLWFDFMVDQSTQHRCRLSWVSPMRTRLLFTNRDGFDAFVRSEREVAALLRLGRLTVIDQHPIVSRALDRLMAGADQQRVA